MPRQQAHHKEYFVPRLSDIYKKRNATSNKIWTHSRDTSATELNKLLLTIILTVLTQFEDLNLVNADATDETKLVTTKFVLGFCHGQFWFCLLVRIGPMNLSPLKVTSQTHILGDPGARLSGARKIKRRFRSARKFTLVVNHTTKVNFRADRNRRFIFLAPDNLAPGSPRMPDTMKTYLAFGWFPVYVRHVTLSCLSRSKWEKHTSGTSVKTSEIWWIFP